MDTTSPVTEERFARLERSVRRARWIGTLTCLGIATLAVLALVLQRPGTMEEVRARRLVVVDDKDRERVVIGQDPKDTQRRSRAAGLTLRDEKGTERGGFSTMEDGSVVFAMDAPAGVGDPMPDRIGLVVYPDGSSHVMLLDNQTRAVAKLHSDGEGGGVQVFHWDMEARQIHIRTLTYEGDLRETNSFGD